MIIFFEDRPVYWIMWKNMVYTHTHTHTHTHTGHRGQYNSTHSDSLNSGEHRLCRVLSKSGENLESMGQTLFTPVSKVRLSLHILLINLTLNSVAEPGGRQYRMSCKSAQNCGK